MKKVIILLGAIFLSSCEVQEICDCEIVTYEVEYTSVFNPQTGLVEITSEFIETNRECTNFDDPTPEQFNYEFGDEVIIQKQCP